ncbi:hypothetical protein CLOAM0510 [Candidatus Cloacimonas acidaminovorans str. Evry]|uniref:Uncharacterized protein n=1 Tax=Cloacimonas acidaminovorans (strain Evry) TaxID=459349 RepID=B0VGH0_CLOAI|nr:hypothetical protein CLOAM0510 [Candidatus Cloacimonas acidaminovorans str. Evry]
MPSGHSYYIHLVTSSQALFHNKPPWANPLHIEIKCIGFIRLSLIFSNGFERYSFPLIQFTE